jgi:hypothetical protein
MTRNTYFLLYQVRITIKPKRKQNGTGQRHRVGEGFVA